MSGILYEDDEEIEAGSDVAELERILEESEQESQHEESDIPTARSERPKSALSVLQRSSENGFHRKKSIHWKDDEPLPPSSSPSPSPSPPAAHARSRAPPAQRGAHTQAQAQVSSFRRSLKLLGLQPHEFGVEEPERVQRTGSGTGTCRRAPRAAVTTRLRTRSVSLDDLRAAARARGRDGRLTPDVLKDGDVYRMISSAVYEEWYFRKQREEQERKRRQQEQERRTAEELERRQADIKQKSQEKFDEWLRRKSQQLKQSNNVKGPAAEVSRPFRVLPEQAERAFEEWKRSKDKLRAQPVAPPPPASAPAQAQLPRRHAQPDAEARREDAEKAYLSWKKRVEELQRKETLKKKQREEKELAEKQRKEEEKKEMSRKSFEHWKTVKDEEQRKAEEKARRQRARAEAREAERREQRQYEAQQAFLTWLDQVDERERDRERDRKQGAPEVPLFSFRPARRHSCST